MPTLNAANNLNTKIFTHSFVIGIIPGGIGTKKAAASNCGRKNILSLLT